MDTPKVGSTSSSGNETNLSGGPLDNKLKTNKSALLKGPQPTDQTPPSQPTDNTNQTANSPSDTSTGQTAPTTPQGSDAPPNSTPVEQNLNKNNGVTFGCVY